jgi:hypothetical protein
MIVNRLSYFLEHRGLLSQCQSGFSKGRSTLDALVKMRNEVEKNSGHEKSDGYCFFSPFKRPMTRCGEKAY